MLPERNMVLIQRVLAQIEARPETWDQSIWHTDCGTAHCFAGWAQVLEGLPASVFSVVDDARKALGFTPYEAAHYFASNRTLEELKELAVPLDHAGYDHEGYDRSGRDREGYNREGYNWSGRDRNGNCAKSDKEYKQ